VSVVANVAINVDSSGAVSKLRQVQQGAQATSQAVDKLNATTAATSDKFKIAANGIKYFTDAAGRARAENGRFLTTAERAAAGIKLQGDAAQQSSGKLNGLRNALASLGAGLALRKAFGDASELESAQARIGLLTKNFQQLSGIQGVAANAAQKFNLSQSESLNALTDLGNRIGPTGASLQDITNVYEGFNTLLALNKVNSQNAASATLQLNQALGSGRLAGEEFNAISEATPQLLDAVAKVMGRNRGELKQLASDGQISSQVLIEALKRIRTEGAADLEASFGGAFGATRRFNAALEDFSATVGTELLPALTPLINKATEILKLFGELPGPVKTTAVAILGLTAAFVVLAPAVAAVSLAAAPWIALAAGIAAAGLAILDAANAQRDFNNVIATAPLPDVNAKIQELESKLRAAETKLADVTAQFGPLSREAAFAQASVDGLKGSLDLAKGDYKIRLLFESVGVKPDARFLGPGFAAPATPTRATPLPSVGNSTGRNAGADKAANEAKRREEEAKREAKRVADVIRDQQFITKQKGIQTKFAQLIFEAEQAVDPIRVRQLQTVEALVLAGNETARLLEKEENSSARLAIARTRQGEAEAIRQQGLQDVLKLQIEQQKNFDEIIAGLDLELALKSATTEEAREQLRLANELAKLQGQGFTDEQIGAITAKKTELARPKTDMERLQGAAAGVKEELAKLTDPINMITTAAAGIGDAFSTSFKGIISGSMTAKEALASFFTSVADMFLDMAAQIIAKMITMAILNQVLGVLPGAGSAGGFTAGPLAAVGDVGTGFNFDAGAMLNFGGFKAKGGPVSSGQTYMVGERGPELFVPGRSGTIVANDKMGGGSTNVVVNVDASGSNVEGDAEDSKQLGRVIAAAIQQELVKQKRPGGLLA
jgi:tape measure domain-containing protein